jgi:hypothetical protein
VIGGDGARQLGIGFAGGGGTFSSAASFFDVSFDISSCAGALS